MVVLTTDPEKIKALARGHQRLSRRGRSSTGSRCNQRVHEDARPAVRRDAGTMARRSSAICSRTCRTRTTATTAREDMKSRGGRQRARQAREQDHHRRLPAGRLRHPHRALSRARARPRSASARTARCSPTSRCPHAYRNALAARIKIMCDLDISERRKPQDGKIKFKKFGPLDIELRVATIPSQGGVEDIVMRILAAGEPIPIDKLGLSDAQPRRGARTVIEKPYGLFFVLRPDRLRQDDDAALGARLPQHARHQDLDRGRPGRNHAEGLAPGADESARRGSTFAVAMRAFLRADPDIIMVGEMRDKETTVDRHRSLAHRPPGVRDAAHEQRAGIDRAPARHGHGPVQFRRRAARHPGAAAGEAPVRSARSRMSPTRGRDRGAARRIFAGAAEHDRPGRRTRKAATRSCSRTGSRTSATRRARSRSTRQSAATCAAAPATRAGSACTSCWSAPTRSRRTSRSTRASPRCSPRRSKTACAR